VELDTDKIDQAVLALLALGRHDGYRTWKSFDWESMGRLHEKGYITDPIGKANALHRRRLARIEAAAAGSIWARAEPR
jgi:hypothetical protein